ncbi:S-layer homology domain-containing protein [Ructibacterium gallinarum]|uniref:S-layer homology domain-containing protein n=1 Tax=Ructibacterium gallinarum TaxID=2779355 RepID=A0A9D5M2C4_9FIRM|nr:S-layer homology domain-containing protein [Ructibacterium gallinarum]MBE5040193.1 S-layer homology domain-containing protein [Ructibacterium gallinarum]
MGKRIWKKCIAGLIGIALLGSCFGLPGGTALAEERFFDNLTDLSLCYAAGTTADNIGFSTKDLSASQGIADKDRVYKKADTGALDTQTYLVYQTKQAFVSFQVDAVYSMKNGKIAGDLQFETSADGETYTPYTQVVRTDAKEGEFWEESQWRSIVFASEGALPEGTQYIRIAFGATSHIGQSGNTTHQISNVTLGIAEMEVDYRALLSQTLERAQSKLDNAQVGTEPGMYPKEAVDTLTTAVSMAQEAVSDSDADTALLEEALTMLEEALVVFQQSVVPEAVFVDECDSASFPYRRSEDIQVATSSPEKFEGDGTRYYKKLNHGGEWVEYKMEEGKRAQTVTLDTWYYKSNGSLAEDCTVEYSKDGQVYETAAAVRTADEAGWANGEWRKVVFSVSDLPLGVEYIRVNLGDTTATGALYAVQIGRVTIQVAANYEKLLQNKIQEAEELLSRVPGGNQPGMCPESVRNQLVTQKDAAAQLLEGAGEEEQKQAIAALEEAILAVENAIIYAVQWPQDAQLTAKAESASEISLSWPGAEASGTITYEVYQGEKRIGTTEQTTYRVENLAPGIDYAFQVVAVVPAGKSKPLGPVQAQTAKPKEFMPPDFSLITPDSFEDEDYLAPLIWKDDTRGIPYYYFNLYKILNAVRMEEPDRGFVDIFVSRRYSAFNPINVRIQEAYLPITYFYTRNDSWNEYYNNPEVKVRLEAVLQHVLDLQKTETDAAKGEYAGAFPQSTTNTYDLAGTTFTLNFLGQALKLLHEAEETQMGFRSIDPDLFQRLNEACRKAIILTLTNEAWYEYGLQYSNQYGLIWSATAAYLEYNPDPEIESLLKEKYQHSDEFISPAGFYYEEGAFDMSYNLGVHTNNISAEYTYFKDTDMEAKLIEDQTRFIDWLSYNLVIEPDGSWFSTNGAPSRRITTTGYSIYRKDMPIAEKIPMARAFVRSDVDIEDEIARNKSAITEGGAWPVLPEMTLRGGDAYNAYGVFDRLMYQYVPTEAERWEAIESLPYMASENFNHQRADEESYLEFTYIRRPYYYTIFNAGKQFNNMQVFGQGLLWHPEGGIMIASQSEEKDTTDSEKAPKANDFSWGTKSYDPNRKQSIERVYENGTIWGQQGGSANQNLVYTVNGQSLQPQTGIADLPEGDIAVSYDLTESGEKKGNKTIRYAEDGIHVSVQHPGGLQECFPLMIRDEDKLEVQGDRVKLVRGRAVMEIVFDQTVKMEISKKNYTMSRYQMNMLTAATTNDALSYTIYMGIEEPKVREIDGSVQVTENQISGQELNGAALPEESEEAETPAETETAENAGVSEEETDSVFADTKGHWAEEDINYLAEKGVIEGVDQTHFEPDRSITRAEFTAILAEYLELDQTQGAPFAGFVDVQPDAWYYGAVMGCAQKGIVQGIDAEHFAPDMNISRAEMDLICMRVYTYLLTQETSPRNDATRADASVLIRRLLEDIDRIAG